MQRSTAKIRKICQAFKEGEEFILENQNKPEGFCEEASAITGTCLRFTPEEVHFLTVNG